MPIHPFDPSRSDEQREDPPDIGDIVDRILGGDGDSASPSSTDG